MNYINQISDFSSADLLALLTLLLPFTSFVFLFFLANFLPRKGDFVAAGLSGLSLIASIILFSNVWGRELPVSVLKWFSLFTSQGIIEFTASIKLNSLSALMLLLVNFISFLVHIYSIEYMKGKKNYVRYFPYLGLFTFSMTGIVLSDNLLITFMFWEMVGFSSYLLIGFWYEKEAANRAAKKAFLFNRIGDTGFILALVAVYLFAGTFELSAIQIMPIDFGSALFILIGLGLFAGSVGKSAQFPLQAWLPDAMEGPTPASALIHAATMVAAGVYLLLKTYFLLSPGVLTIIAVVGSITAFAGALPALFQQDIKKVLAFSTVSQLGFMIMAIGVGAYSAAFFHLIAHGFFKAGLFLSAGSVIHNMHHVKHELFLKGQYKDFDAQDMRLMGGLRKVLPVTFFAFSVCAMSLSGLPFFSGFLSKDAILESVFRWKMLDENPVLYVVPLLAAITVLITALYMTRQILRIFFGEFRLVQLYPKFSALKDFLHEPSWLMKLPLIILSLCSFWFVFSPNPLSVNNGWLIQIQTTWVTAVVSILLALTGVLIGLFFYRKPVNTITAGPIEKYIGDNWFIDRIYYLTLVKPGFFAADCMAWLDRKVVDGIVHFFAVSGVVLAHVIAWFDKFFVDGTVNLSAWIASKSGGAVRTIQSGRIQGYFVAVLFILLILLIWIIIA